MKTQIHWGKANSVVDLGLSRVQSNSTDTIKVGNASLGCSCMRYRWKTYDTLNRILI